MSDKKDKDKKDKDKKDKDKDEKKDKDKKDKDKDEKKDKDKKDKDKDEKNKDKDKKDKDKTDKDKSDKGKDKDKTDKDKDKAQDKDKDKDKKDKDKEKDKKDKDKKDEKKKGIKERESEPCTVGGTDVDEDQTVHHIAMTMTFDGGKVIIVPASGEKTEGKLKKGHLSWKTSTASYEGKCTGNNPALPDHIEGTYEKKAGGKGTFSYDLHQQLLDPNVKIEGNLKKEESKKAKKEKQKKTKKEVKETKAENYGSLWCQVTQKLGGKQWTDPDFPPNSSSIGGLQVGGRDPEWKRASEIFPNGKLFQDGVSPHDIRQGSLGDCYFLAALAALAEFPTNISPIFTCPDNKHGCYSMTFYPKGIKTEVLVDDFIPTTAGKPCFSRAQGEELWVLLIEKAYAKCYGSYKGIVAGFAQMALYELTGSPAVSYVNATLGADKVFSTLRAADEAKFMMLASTPGVDSGNFITADTGLCAGHAYTILDAREWKGNQLVKIRNPWGNTEWTGPWGDKDSRWTSESKAALGWEDRNDGAYWMDVASFMKYFQRFTVNATRPTDFHASTGFKLVPGKNPTGTFELSGEGIVCVSLVQGRLTEPTTVGICISISGSGGKNYFRSSNYFREYIVSSPELKLPSGKYTVLIEIYDGPQHKGPSVGYLSVQSTSKVTASGGDIEKYVYPKPTKKK